MNPANCPTRRYSFLPSRAILLLSALIAFIGVGCGGGGGGGTPPPPPTYSIGGSISGLGNSGLVLQNNSGDDLTIANGSSSFTFANKLTASSGYAVTVLSQPVGQNCTITNGTDAGTVANANITSVSVSCLLGDQDASGLYDGSGNVAFTLVQSGANIPLIDVKGIIHKNRFMFFNIDVNGNKTGAGGQDTNVLIDGTITNITKNDLVGTASVYRAGELVSDNVVVTGLITEESGISLTLASAPNVVTTPIKTTGDFKGGTFTGVFNTAYNDQAASIDAIETDSNLNRWGSNLIIGVYHLFAGGRTSTMSFDKDTTRYSNNVSSVEVCQYNGKVSIPTSGFKNIYTMATDFPVANLKDCVDLGGQVNYTGFAAVFTNLNAIDFLWYAETNGSYSVYALFDRVNK